MEHTRAYIGGVQTHTHTHAGRGRSEFTLCFYPILDCPSSRTPQEQWAAFRRPGTKLSDPSWSGTDSSVLLHVFLLGFLVEETPCEHGEEHANSTQKGPGNSPPEHWRPGENLPPRTKSASCGNRTQDLLAVRQQCKHLSHKL